MKRLLLFDFDGVLVDSLDYFSTRFLAACRALGLAGPEDRAGFLRLFDGNLYAGLEQAGVPAEAVPGLLAELGRRCGDADRQVKFFPGVPAVLEGLREENRLLVISSNLTDVVARCLDRGGVRGVEAVLGADRGVSKTAKIGAVRAAAEGAECWYIGDTRGDMVEGRVAGARTVAAAWGWHDEARLRSGGPDRIARRPADLLVWFGGGRGERTTR